MTKKIQFFAFFILTILNLNSVTSQGTTALNKFSDFSLIDGGVESVQTIFKTMNQDDLLKITIESDIDNLLENKLKDDYQDAKLSIASSDGVELHDVSIKPRGKFRRRTCEFPPIKIKFKKSGLKEKGISTSHKSLKLVTHCMETEEAQQTILKEYLAYKMYNVLTDASFKVQLVEITYVNAGKGLEDQVKYGFIIENTDEMAERIGGLELEDRYNLSLDSIQGQYRHIIPMFQYMISNMDWRPHSMQNLKLVEKENGDKLLVPYDFDFSGLVDAPYSRPDVDYHQTSVKQRIYRNRVDDLKTLMPTIKYFQIHKNEIYKTVKDCDRLSKKNRRKMISFLNDFYYTLSDKSFAEDAFVK